MYNTSLPVLFAVKKYADALWKVCNEKDIQVNLTTNLIEIKPDRKEAIFQDLKNPDKKKTIQVCAQASFEKTFLLLSFTYFLRARFRKLTIFCAKRNNLVCNLIFFGLNLRCIYPRVFNFK